MKILRMYPSNINERYLDEICDCLNDGGIILYPTDTLYALGCDALSNSAVERLCKVRGLNPQKQALSIICADLSMASDFAKIDNKAFAVLKRNVPGPFTFILPTSNSLPKVFKGRREVGIRIPDNPIARAIAERLGHPILSASVKIENEDVFYPQELGEEYDGKAELLIDEGNEAVSTTPSTVVDLTDSSDPEILREGKGRLE